MAAPIRIFLETVHHTAFRYGGWAWARDVGGAMAASAGGERAVTPGRLDLLALAAALADLPPGAPVALHSASPGVLAAARLLASPPAPGSEEAPKEDLDLWARGLRAIQGRAFTVVPAAAGDPGTPQAFLSAWAEVGQDKAKGQGRFTAAIPKTNLAKLRL